MEPQDRRPAQLEKSREHGNGDAQPAQSEVYTKNGLACVDVLSWLGRATLDVIGEAGSLPFGCHLAYGAYSPSGFGYQFNALSSQDNELSNAFGVIFSTARKVRVLSILQIWFPLLRRFVSRLPHLIYCIVRLTYLADHVAAQ